MKTNEKGYSLNVLVITIAVMLILTTTAILTMKSLTGDKEITNFMSDLQEVDEFVKEYYSRKNTLPIVYKNEEPSVVNLTGAMEAQADKTDSGAYYEVDLEKLEKIKLYDENRGYIINETTLKVYVANPIEYNKVKYYTLTDELLGFDKAYGTADSFEVIVTGNPITWSSKFKLMVSVPDQDDINSRWSFKYYKNGPITAKQFEELGTFFEYGEAIEIEENGIHSIYVENEEGQAKVVNVIVTMIDDKSPYVYVENYDDIVVADDETGVKNVMYKIVDYSIGENYRAEKAEIYVQGTPDHLQNSYQGGRWSFEEAYTGERIDTIEPSIGKNINQYKAYYEEYLEKQGEVIALVPEDTENYDEEVRIALKNELDDIYPTFQYNGVPYEDDEKNIALYVEDFAGNRGASDKNQTNLALVSREMLLSNSFIDVIIKPLNNANLTIENGAKYTTDKKVDLLIRAQGAEYMYISTDENDIPPENIDDWQEFETIVNNYELLLDEGEATVYIYVTANQLEDGKLKYVRISNSIIIDTIKPSDDTPTVSPVGNNLKLNITCNQKETGSGIEKIEYGYKLKEDTEYKWTESLSNVKLEANKMYDIKTKVTDKAGNIQESKVVEIETPVQVTRTLPNAPAMASGMKAIVWDGNLIQPGKEIEINEITWENANGEKLTWYNYSMGDGVTDSKDSIWANAKTSDGSYFVWIPRFAYRIIYYKDANKTNVNGYYQNSEAHGLQYFASDGKTVIANPDEVKTSYASIDIVFLSGNSNLEYKEENLATKVVTSKTLSKEYIVHPAFQGVESSVVNNSLGKWSSDITGIWVAKFEASRNDAKIDEVGVEEKIKVVPSVKSWTNLDVADAYDYCLEMYPSLYSHLMKNSEWGAVAYLAYSAYGRNGNEISSNRSADYITGGGGAITSYTCSPSKFESTYAYNVINEVSSKSGMNSSTTGNIYGVYDMAGGVAEFVAAYLANDSDMIDENGQPLTEASSVYLRERYSVADTDEPINNYNKHGVNDKVYGNAIYETSKGYIGNYSFNDDASNYPKKDTPFILRGGLATGGTSSGIFSFDVSNGEAVSNIGFRPVLSFR